MEGLKHHLILSKVHLVTICFHMLLLLEISRKAFSHITVPYLPGFRGPLPFELETGYIGVDDLDEVQLFYYFVKSENNPSEDPLLLWLTGGPGCSTLTALAFEIGPFHFEAAEDNGDIPSLVLNPNSWTKVSGYFSNMVCNIIFLDAPVGTGFSYSRSQRGAYSSDTKSAQQATTFIKKWLTDHKEFLSNPLYIGGDSYSGKTVPVIVQDISDDIEAGGKPHINLKGYLLGNPLTDAEVEENSKVPFLHGMGIIPDELFENHGVIYHLHAGQDKDIYLLVVQNAAVCLSSCKEDCRGDYTKKGSHSVQCMNDLQLVTECASGLDMNNILDPICSFATPKSIGTNKNPSVHGDYSAERYLLDRTAQEEFKCRSYGYRLAYDWANNDRVQNALNIRKGTVKEWIRCNYFGINYVINVEETISYHLYLSKKNYRSLIYSGDHDLIVPYISTQAWIRSLNYSIKEEWRPWLLGGQVAGYTRTYTNNMTFATVKGAGHTAPEYMPKECFAMFKRWLPYQSL